MVDTFQSISDIKNSRDNIKNNNNTQYVVVDPQEIRGSRKQKLAKTEPRKTGRKCPENQNRPHKGKPRQQDTPERAAIPLYNIHVHKRIQQKDHQTLRLVVFLIAYVHRHDELLDIHIITRFVV